MKKKKQPQVINFDEKFVIPQINYTLENLIRGKAKFKKSEMDAINSYCITNDIPKNTLLRMAIMEYIGNPIKE